MHNRTVLSAAVVVVAAAATAVSGQAGASAASFSIAAAASGNKVVARSNTLPAGSVACALTDERTGQILATAKRPARPMTVTSRSLKSGRYAVSVTCFTDTASAGYYPGATSNKVDIVIGRA